MESLAGSTGRLTSPGSASVLDAMVKTLFRRGPDAEGVWLSPQAALVYRRLVVVGPEGGGQPMMRRCGNSVYTIT